VVEFHNFLDEVRDALADESLPPRQRLERAGRLFWHAYVYQGSRWSPQFQQAGGKLLTRLMSEGRVSKTVASMDARQVASMCRELARFVDECEPS